MPWERLEAALHGGSAWPFSLPLPAISPALLQLLWPAISLPHLAVMPARLVPPPTPPVRALRWIIPYPGQRAPPWIRLHADTALVARTDAPSPQYYPYHPRAVGRAAWHYD